MLTILAQTEPTTWADVAFAAVSSIPVCFFIWRVFRN
jgi:hypothetical protein